MTKPPIPPDLHRDLADMIAKALFARLPNQGRSAVITQDEMREAADQQFEIDLLDDGSVLFQRALND